MITSSEKDCKRVQVRAQKIISPRHRIVQSIARLCTRPESDPCLSRPALWRTSSPRSDQVLCDGGRQPSRNWAHSACLYLFLLVKTLVSGGGTLCMHRLDTSASCRNCAYFPCDRKRTILEESRGKYDFSSRTPSLPFLCLSPVCHPPGMM